MFIAVPPGQRLVEIDRSYRMFGLCPLARIGEALHIDGTTWRLDG